MNVEKKRYTQARAIIDELEDVFGLGYTLRNPVGFALRDKIRELIGQFENSLIGSKNLQEFLLKITSNISGFGEPRNLTYWIYIYVQNEITRVNSLIEGIESRLEERDGVL